MYSCTSCAISQVIGQHSWRACTELTNVHLRRTQSVNQHHGKHAYSDMFMGKAQPACFQQEQARHTL